MQQPDVVIAGAGVIGMTLALELCRRGRRVTVLERGTPGSGASSAAAGMLAANDPANPSGLRPLAERSIHLYPALFDVIRSIVPAQRMLFETAWTMEQSGAANHHESLPGLETAGHSFSLIRECSIDPRRLISALVAAATSAGVQFITGTVKGNLHALSSGTLRVETSASSITCEQFVDCTGAWSGVAVRPVKGQMLRVHMGQRNPQLPGRGNIVLRTPQTYLVPRSDGSLLIGSTLEEKGFCIKTKDATIADLRARAANLYPAVLDAPELERWAGVRPATIDGLPVLGPMPGTATPGAYVASGHFRNGILLAPGTARVMAQLLCGEQTDVDLQPFAPARFAVAQPSQVSGSKR